jgi:hypothetical protein
MQMLGVLQLALRVGLPHSLIQVGVDLKLLCADTLNVASRFHAEIRFVLRNLFRFDSVFRKIKTRRRVSQGPIDPEN